MPLKLHCPLCFFDLETTGVDVMRDRIVDVCAMRRSVDGEESILASLVNPGRKIPPEAIAVHHITDEMVKDAPTFAQLAMATQPTPIKARNAVRRLMQAHALKLERVVRALDEFATTK